MNKDTFKLDKALSIVELESRQELTIAAIVEAGKGKDPDDGIGITVPGPFGGRCG